MSDGCTERPSSEPFPRKHEIRLLIIFWSRAPSCPGYLSVVPSLPLCSLYSSKFPWSERKGLRSVLWTVMISPFGKVRFLEGYVGDILTRWEGSPGGV